MNKIEEKSKVSKKAPIIKQTLTSIYRLAKVNPLVIKSDHVETEDCKYRNISLPRAVTSVYGKQDTPLIFPKDTNDLLKKETNKQVLRSSKSTSSLLKSKPFSNPTLQPSKSSVLLSAPKPTKFTSAKNPKFLKPSTLPQSKPPISQSRPSSSQSKSSAKLFKKPNKLLNPVSNKQKLQKVRRSRSAEKFKVEVVKATYPEKSILKSELTQSLEGLEAIECVSQNKKVSFQSPRAYNRRNSDRPRFLRTSTPLKAASNELYDKLNNWLKQNGKIASSYHHLKCFDVPETIIEQLQENKENIEESYPCTNSSYEDLKIVIDKEEAAEGGKQVESAKCDSKDSSKSLNLVKEALNELNKLIFDNYPMDQCESWLAAIRSKFKNIEDTSQYWECRAAIEQRRENFAEAVEFYQKAIVKGAEVDLVDGSLESLLEKFSLLNIDTSTKNDKKLLKRKKKIQEEAKNVFKSSIIQFAVQERKLLKQQLQDKENEKKFVATPVKRSTRHSRCSHISTPGIKIYNSLHDVEDTINESLSFKRNNYIQ